jgi:hypothetical protein
MRLTWNQKIVAVGIVGLLSSLSCPFSALAQITSPQPTPDPTPDPTTTPRFTCQFLNGQYTVTYSPESQPNQSYPWAVPTQLGGGWTPDRRCSEISRRLESYRPDGLLELQTGRENNYNTVCVTTQQSGACRIVFTVPPGQDPIATRDAVFQNLVLADGGSTTQPVNTIVSPNNSSIFNDLGQILNQGLPNWGRLDRPTGRNIDLRPFLDARDGGTGTYLQEGWRLNPDHFR